MQNHGDLSDVPYDLEKMCMHAIDRSQGQLVDITIEYFGTDELMEYLAQGGRYCSSVVSILSMFVIYVCVSVGIIVNAVFFFDYICLAF